uniref:Protein kinase domain-containing protein n=1 Tax=Arundo donax TaxID=35708 RepID=A0A0A9CFM8_ARUDO
MRLKIAIDVASSLEYLHQHKPLPIIHCDLKPSNVLLDSDMVAHVGDFGLARFLHQDLQRGVEDEGDAAIEVAASHGDCAFQPGAEPGSSDNFTGSLEPDRRARGVEESENSVGGVGREAAGRD